MTALEQGMLQGLVDRVNKTQLGDKDLDAEGMLQNTLGRNPDALYILTQTVLVQGYALEQAQKQLADARGQMDQLRQQAATAQAPTKHTSFLGTLLGRDEEPARTVPPSPAQAQYAPMPAYPSATPEYHAGHASGGGGFGQPGGHGATQEGGFLRSALQTATGVAAGALAFEGLENLMHGFGHAAGYGSEFGGSQGFGGALREEGINNYYGDSAGEEHHTGMSSDTCAASSPHETDWPEPGV